MKAVNLSLVVILLSLTTLMAQEKSADHLEKSVFSLDLFAPGITFEGALGDFTSFVLGANAGISFYAYTNTNWLLKGRIKKAIIFSLVKGFT